MYRNDKENAAPITKEAKKKFELPKYLANKPKHVQDLLTIFANNAEIRRFVSNSIINYLLQKEIIPSNAVNKWVDFKNNVIVTYTTISESGDKDTTRKEYSYTRDFFANCFVAGFQSFAANAQKVLDTYIVHETNTTLEKTVNMEEIENIVALNNATIESQCPKE